MTEEATKRCPYCGEKIKPAAVKCRHCGEWLAEQSQIPTPPSMPEPAPEPTPAPPTQSTAAPTYTTVTPAYMQSPTSAPQSTPGVRKPGFLEYYFLDLFIRHYADFGGKTSRKQFWFGYLCMSMLYFMLFSLDLVTGLLIVWTLIGLITLTIPFVAATVRRLHDTGRSGWWFFIQFVPIVGAVWLLVLLVQEGETKSEEGVKFQMPTDYVIVAATVLITVTSLVFFVVNAFTAAMNEGDLDDEDWESRYEAPTPIHAPAATIYFQDVIHHTNHTL